MSLTDSQGTEWKPVVNTPTGDGDSLRNLQKITMGSGSSRLEANIKDGFWMGADTFALAPLKMDFLGNLTASSVTIKNENGDVLIDSNSSTLDYIQIINSSLNTASKTILGGFTFSSTDYAGAFKTGDVTWSPTTGLPTGGSGFVINAKGILGVNAGVTKISILNDGNATFAGTLAAASGTFGTITSGTITGTSIKATSATSGANIFIDPNNKRISFLYDNVEKAFMYADASGDLVIDADNLLKLIADGAGDDITLLADDLVYTQSDILWSQCNGYRTAYCDNDFVNFNDDNTGGGCSWIDKGDTEMRLDIAGDLYIDGSFIDTGADYAEYFESVDGTEIPVGTTVVIEEGKIRPAVEGEQPIGIISGKPSFIGNSEPDCGKSWNGKYLTDEYGRRIIEKVEFWSKLTEEKRTTKGKEKNIARRINGYSDIEKPPKGAKKKMVMREKINTGWDPNKKYIPRKDRPEWNIVGLLGQVAIRKGQPVASNWIKMKEISKDVELYLIK